MFDLLNNCDLLRKHVALGRVCYGINFEMRDFERDRKKNLDLVLFTRGSALDDSDFVDLGRKYAIELNDIEKEALAALPSLRSSKVGAVLMALEAKACMTAHQRALPRLYDELNSSHTTVHGATEQALAVGFAMVNFADEYLSPDLNKANRGANPNWSRHNQPRDGSLVVRKVEQLPRRSNVISNGYDAFSVIGISLRNDGSPVSIFDSPPTPQNGDIYHYETMINRVSHLYSTRFKDLS